MAITRIVPAFFFLALCNIVTGLSVIERPHASHARNLIVDAVSQERDMPESREDKSIPYRSIKLCNSKSPETFAAQVQGKSNCKALTALCKDNKDRTCKFCDGSVIVKKLARGGFLAEKCKDNPTYAKSGRECVPDEEFDPTYAKFCLANKMMMEKGSDVAAMVDKLNGKNTPKEPEPEPEAEIKFSQEAEEEIVKVEEDAQKGICNFVSLHESVRIPGKREVEGEKSGGNPRFKIPVGATHLVFRGHGDKETSTSGGQFPADFDFAIYDDKAMIFSLDQEGGAEWYTNIGLSEAEEKQLVTSRVGEWGKLDTWNYRGLPITTCTDRCDAKIDGTYEENCGLKDFLDKVEETDRMTESYEDEWIYMSKVPDDAKMVIEMQPYDDEAFDARMSYAYCPAACNGECTLKEGWADNFK